MSKISAALVKELREKTGAGIKDCQEALEQNSGQVEKAADWLRQKGISRAEKKADRITTEGAVGSYIHLGGKVGVLIEVNCETDFVAKTDDFKAFARNIAMHVAAVSPLAVSRDEIPAEVVQREKDIYINQALESGKPQQIAEKMVAGKMEKFLAEVCLLEQKYVKNPDLSVQDLLNELVAKMGENISIKKFARFQIG